MTGDGYVLVRPEDITAAIVEIVTEAIPARYLHQVITALELRAERDHAAIMARAAELFGEEEGA